MRTYQLHPGYGSVPKLLETFAKGWVASYVGEEPVLTKMHLGTWLGAQSEGCGCRRSLQLLQRL